MKFLASQGPVVLFLIVLAEQLGLPLPAVPVLLAMGAMVGTGRFSFGGVMAIAVGACIIADFAWYRLGRWRGARVLNWLCRISLEPDSCVRTAQNRLTFGGAPALLVAKFIPGFSTAAPPVAGLIGMRVSRFLLWDGMGAVLWSATYLGLGWIFSNQLERVMRAVTDVGGRAFFLAAAALAAYLAGKTIQRRRFLRQIQLDRITPEELNARLAAGEDIVVPWPAGSRGGVRRDTRWKRPPIVVKAALLRNPGAKRGCGVSTVTFSRRKSCRAPQPRPERRKVFFRTLRPLRGITQWRTKVIRRGTSSRPTSRPSPAARAAGRSRARADRAGWAVGRRAARAAGSPARADRRADRAGRADRAAEWAVGKRADRVAEWAVGKRADRAAGSPAKDRAGRRADRADRADRVAEWAAGRSPARADRVGRAGRSQARAGRAAGWAVARRVDRAAIASH